MTILLNFGPAILILFWVLFWRKTRKLGASCVGLITSLLIYMMIQPSYLPKGTVERTGVPDFEHTDTVVQDRLRKTDPAKNYENAQQMHEQFMRKD